MGLATGMEYSSEEQKLKFKRTESVALHGIKPTIQALIDLVIEEPRVEALVLKKLQKKGPGKQE